MEIRGSRRNPPRSAPGEGPLSGRATAIGAGDLWRPLSTTAHRLAGLELPHEMRASAARLPAAKAPATTPARVDRLIVELRAHGQDTHNLEIAVEAIHSRHQLRSREVHMGITGDEIDVRIEGIGILRNFVGQN